MDASSQKKDDSRVVRLEKESVNQDGLAVTENVVDSGQEQQNRAEARLLERL